MFHNETVHNLVLNDRSLGGGLKQSSTMIPWSYTNLLSTCVCFCPQHSLTPSVSGSTLGMKNSSVLSAGLLKVVQCLDISSSGWRPDL